MDRDDTRPDPDKILAMVKEEERKKKRGKLTVFLGYSAGVGKTYAMLETAHQQKRKGIDVAIACITTHGRRETEMLARGLEKIPLHKILYKGMELEEMDIDSVIARRPQIALVDELAHTNVPGSRHVKRHQDVQELLNEGIDVYTTLNVQHLESMNDLVAQVTGILVKETLPDTVLNEADEIKLVDLPPNDLIQRFKEGKIYIPDQAELAMDNFFNEGNLIALREMTFRVAAEHVDEKMLEYMKSKSIEHLWRVKEKLLICIGGSKDLNERLIHTGKRLADELKTEWHVLYVEDASRNKKSEISKANAMEGIELASSLGAKTATTFGVSIVDEVLRYAKTNNITRVTVGRITRRSFWNELFHKDVVDKLAKLDTEFDLMIISYQKPDESEKSDKLNSAEDKIKSSSLRQYAVGASIVILLTILNLILDGPLDPVCLIMIAMLGVVVSSMILDTWPAIFTAVLSIALFDFLFIPPYYTFTIGDLQYLIALCVFLVVGIVVSILSKKTRDYSLAAQRRDEYTSTQYSLSLDLVTTTDVESVLDAMKTHVMQACQCKSAYFIPLEGSLQLVRISDGLHIYGKELSVAKWVYKNGIPAGKDTNTLSSAELKYYPIQTNDTILGVVGVEMNNPDKSVRLEQEKIIQSFANQVSLAIERINLSKKLESNSDLMGPIRHYATYISTRGTAKSKNNKPNQ